MLYDENVKIITKSTFSYTVRRILVSNIKDSLFLPRHVFISLLFYIENPALAPNLGNKYE
jgi:hypothetical protein